MELPKIIYLQFGFIKQFYCFQGDVIYTFSYKMKNKKYHNVGTVSKSNRKTKNTTLSKQFQNLIEKQKIPQFQNCFKIQ